MSHPYPPSIASSHPASVPREYQRPRAITPLISFIASLERRIKRRRIMRAVHELRSIAHVVDMHQLTKDPGHALRETKNTPSSPRRTLDKVSLERYLDYCTEMLSITGKIAALYVKDFDDSVVVASVNEVEALSSALSSKIWQKMMILEGFHASDSTL